MELRDQLKEVRRKIATLQAQERVLQARINQDDARALSREAEAAKQRAQPRFLEFPYFVLPSVDVPPDWVDTSWHNDVCPSWVTPSGIKVLIDHAVPEKREVRGSRAFTAWSVETGELLLATDNWADLLKRVSQKS